MPSDKPGKKKKHSSSQVVGFARSWIERILYFTAQDSEASFIENEERQLAVQRCFTALGEALKDVPDEVLAQEPDVPWEDVKGFRDVVAHDYWGGLTRRRIWDTIKIDLPVLNAALARIEALLLNDKDGEEHKS